MMKKLVLFLLLAGSAVAQLTDLEKCQQGACYGLGAPSGRSQNGFIWQDLSQSPPQFYCGKNGAWTTCGATGATFPATTGIVYSTSTTASTTATTTQVNTALGVSNGTFISGDSIACFTGATGIQNAFSSLLKNPIGGWWSNNCRPGDMAADENIKTIFRATYAQGSGLDPVYVTELGTNDAINYLGDANKQKIFQRITLANLSWQAVPVGNRKFAQTCTLAGGFAADNTVTSSIASNPYLGLQIVGSTTGATASCLFSAPKANDALYIWYKIADGTTGTFTVSIDGVLQNDPFNGTTTWVASGDGGSAISTPNGVTTAIAAARFTGLSAGNHTILITVTSTGQNVWFDGIGFAPASSLNNPYVVAVSPNQQNVGSAGSPYVATYQGYISSISSNLAADGLNVSYADTSNALLNDPTCGNGNQAAMFSNCYVDAVHPNNAGHAVMANTILASLPTAKKTGSNAFVGYTPLKTYTPQGNPIGPLGMTDVNPDNFASSTAYNPGITFFSGQGQMEYIAHQGLTQLTISTPVGVDFSICKSGAGGYFSPTPPAIADCGYQYKGNGAHQFAGGAGSVGGTTIQPGLLQTGTSVTVTLGGPFSTQSLIGPATAPTGACSPNGKWAFSQDGHATYCNAGTWTTVI